MIRRQRQQYLVVTFSSTAAALQWEQEARKAGFGGRLIPIPETLSAGCGLAWRDAPAQEMPLRALAERMKIPAEGYHLLIL